MYWPLMKSAIKKRDRLKMAWFALTADKFTNGPKVREFEEKWSEWLGVKHSLYVSSGSTANTLLVASLKEYYDLKDGDKVLVPACTWATNVGPIIQAGLQPIFCDINLDNFSFDVDEFEYIKSQHPDIKVIFITHLLGWSGDVEWVSQIWPKALIIEDVCESHGVLDRNGVKRGSCLYDRGKRCTEQVINGQILDTSEVVSQGATFSFYFGHHMTTIEGGMVSTNNSELYQLMRMKRSHGLAREADYPYYQKYTVQNPQCDPKFLFMTDGYNLRNHEICAVLGLSQLKRLDENIQIRRKNYWMFMSIMVNYRDDKFYYPVYQEGNSCFCFPIIPKGIAMTQRLKQIFDEEGIEYRPIISGNLLRHPAFEKYGPICTERELPNVCILHQHGLYIGNSQFVTPKMMDKLSRILESV